MQEASKVRLGRVLRWASYVILLGGFAAFLWIMYAPTTRSGSAPGGSVAAMGHMGAGIAEAVAVLFGGIVISVVSAVLNGMSLSLARRPITKGRRVEFGIFLLPVLLVILAILSFKMR
jgi:hypothetical protein